MGWIWDQPPHSVIKTTLRILNLKSTVDARFCVSTQTFKKSNPIGVVTKKENKL
jgi:hypothetical protein